MVSSGVARGREASENTRPGVQALRAHQHTFVVIEKRDLNRNFDQSILKNV